MVEKEIIAPLISLGAAVDVVLHDGSPSAAMALIDRLLTESDQYILDIDKVDLGTWPGIHIYLPAPDVDSSITPPFMEAFLELQKQVYQFAALVKTGAADVGQLGDSDRQYFQINVKVTGGSSDYVAQLAEPLTRLLRTMIGKMTGRQAAIVILGIAALIGGQLAFSSWLEHKRQTQIEDLKSQEHITALKSLSFANEEQTKLFKQLVEVLEKHGDIGKRAVDAVISVNEALLKAAAKTPEVVVNDNHISKQEAEILRATPKKKPELRIVKERIRVVDINTADPLALQIVIMEPETRNQYRIKFTDTLFTHDDRKKLFDSLATRESIWVELALKEIDGEIRSVQLLRCVDPPPELEAVESDL